MASIDARQSWTHDGNTVRQSSGSPDVPELSQAVRAHAFRKYVEPELEVLLRVAQSRVRQEARPAGARRQDAARLHRHGPNRLWLTDITEHPTLEGKLYLCAVKDEYSNRIAG